MKPVSYVTVWLCFALTVIYAALALGTLMFDDHKDAHHAIPLGITALLFVVLALLGMHIRRQQFDTGDGADGSDAPLVTPLADGGWLVHFNGSELDQMGPDYITLTDRAYDGEESPQA